MKDGYKQKVVNIKGRDGDGPNDDSKGPVMLVHDDIYDGLYWFDRSDPTKPTLVERLFDDNYDVWIYNERGTRPGFIHQ